MPTAGRHWVFVASRGDAVVIQDIATGAVERRIATGEQVEPGMVTAGVDERGQIVLAFGWRDGARGRPDTGYTGKSATPANSSYELASSSWWCAGSSAAARAWCVPRVGVLGRR